MAFGEEDGVVVPAFAFEHHEVDVEPEGDAAFVGFKFVIGTQVDVAAVVTVEVHGRFVVAKTIFHKGGALYFGLQVTGLVDGFAIGEGKPGHKGRWCLREGGDTDKKKNNVESLSKHK